MPKSAVLTALLFFLLSPFAAAADFTAHPLSLEDETILKRVEKDSIQYFVRLSDKKTGLTRDSSRPGSPASIAATGFSLAAVSIASSRGWLDPEYARRYLEKTLRFLLKDAAHERGFFYHFLDMQTGERVWTSEASSIDTALLATGALLAGEYFPDTEIQRMAQQLYERVDWAWMTNGSPLVCMGWTPESGFLPYYWDSYNEHLIIQALAIGSPTHPIDAQSWKAWQRRVGTYNDRTVYYAHSGSLFTYQFPQAFIDFRNLDDDGINYFENSVQASLANRDYSLAHRHLFKTYNEGAWGLSASVGPGGYKAYGAKPGEGEHDGTVAPYAAIGSLVFTPELSLEALRYFWSERQLLYGRFGFKDAYNLEKRWWSDEYLGIDQGITVLMIENFLEDGAIWKKFGQLEAVRNWIERAGLAGKAGPVTPGASDAASAGPPSHQ